MSHKPVVILVTELALPLLEDFRVPRGAREELSIRFLPRTPRIVSCFLRGIRRPPPPGILQSGPLALYVTL